MTLFLRMSLNVIVSDIKNKNQFIFKSKRSINQSLIKKTKTTTATLHITEIIHEQGIKKMKISSTLIVLLNKYGK